MPDKSAASVVSSFESYEKTIERLGRPIRRFHSDKDPAYKSDHFHNLCYQKGIVWEPSIPINPQMNRVSERQG